MSPTLKFRQVLRMLDGDKLIKLPCRTVVNPTFVVALQQWNQFDPTDEVPMGNVYEDGAWVDVPFVCDGVA